MDNKAVIVLDMLNDFVTGGLKCERCIHIIPSLKKLAVVAVNTRCQSSTVATRIFPLMKRSLKDGENTHKGHEGS